MRMSLAPIARAAVIYSVSRMEIVLARTTRTACGIITMPRARVVFVRDGPQRRDYDHRHDEGRKGLEYVNDTLNGEVQRAQDVSTGESQEAAGDAAYGYGSKSHDQRHPWSRV